MKTMKKVILLIVCLVMGAISQLLAQPMNRSGVNTAGIQHLIVQYGDDLELTDDQKHQLIALQTEQRNQFRPEDRPIRRSDRRDFRRDRNEGRRDGRLRNQKREMRSQRFDARLDMRQEVLDIFTDEQIELLRSRMTEQAEKAHEFRTFRHEYIITETGIEGAKAGQVQDLLNAQSESRLELAKQRIRATEEINRGMFADRLQKMKNTDDELRSILTVDEYESLRKNLGFGNRTYGKAGRAHRRWSR